MSLLGGAGMEFEWDADKRLANIEKHGVDFRIAARIFEGPTLDRIDDRRDYGERRLISIGAFDVVVYVVIHTPRPGATRLISAWKGGKRERETYRTLFPGRTPGNA